MAKRASGSTFDNRMTRFVCEIIKSDLFEEESRVECKPKISRKRIIGLIISRLEKQRNKYESRTRNKYARNEYSEVYGYV